MSDDIQKVLNIKKNHAPTTLVNSTNLENVLINLIDYVEKLYNKMQQIEAENKKIHSLYKAIYDIHTNTITHQQMIINYYGRNMLKKCLKMFFRPKLGTLCHYSPRNLLVPKAYKKAITLESSPKISIVTPAYNHANFLERTILSVLDQKYPNLEYIVQDGGSTDSTIDVLKKYESSFKHWASEKDNGQSHAINLGFQYATGEIMAYLNSDDLLLPGTLNYVAKYFSEHPEVDVVYGHRVLIDENDHEIGRWVLPPHDDEILSWADYIPQETLFWRRSIWDKSGAKIDENFKFAMDWDLILRFREAGANFVRLPRFLGAFRVHPDQKSSTQITEVGFEEMNHLRNRCHGHDVPLNQVNERVRRYMLKHLFYHKLYQVGLLRY